MKCGGVAILMCVVVCWSPLLATAQDTLKIVPDGTEGEILATPDSIALRKKEKKPWNQFNLGFTTFKFGLGFLYEYAAYAQDENSKIQMDSLNTPLKPEFKVRDFRILFSGKIKSKRSITWKAGIMYDAPTDEWFIRESGVMVAVPEIWGSIFVGRTKEGFSLNKVMNGYAGWTMERQIALDVIPILGDGIKWLGYLPKQRIIWNVGYYNDVFSEGQGFSTFAWQTAARIAWLPIYEPDKKKQLHLGINLRYGEPLGHKMTLKSRPEVFPAPFFLNTGSFTTDNAIHYGYEAYYTSGALMIGSEYYIHSFGGTGNGRYAFNGGELGISYIFTGESRPYTTAGGGIYGFVPVNKSIFKGGWGAFEAVFRVSHLNLDAANIKGGKFWRLTPMVNWYLAPMLRLELVYGYGVLDRFGIKGATHFFQSRIQFAIL